MDYDSARHHYESLQTAKKKDEAKIAKVRLAVVAAEGESLGVSAGGPSPQGAILLCWSTTPSAGLSLRPGGQGSSAPFAAGFTAGD